MENFRSFVDRSYNAYTKVNRVWALVGLVIMVASLAFKLSDAVAEKKLKNSLFGTLKPPTIMLGVLVLPFDY